MGMRSRFEEYRTQRCPYCGIRGFFGAPGIHPRWDNQSVSARTVYHRQHICRHCHRAPEFCGGVYARPRFPFTTPMNHQQSAYTKVGEMDMLLEAARAGIWKAADKIDQEAPRTWLRKSVAAQMITLENSARVVDLAMRAVEGASYFTAFPLTSESGGSTGSEGGGIADSAPVGEEVGGARPFLWIRGLASRACGLGGGKQRPWVAGSGSAVRPLPAGARRCQGDPLAPGRAFVSARVDQAPAIPRAACQPPCGRPLRAALPRGAAPTPQTKRPGGGAPGARPAASAQRPPCRGAPPKDQAHAPQRLGGRDAPGTPPRRTRHSGRRAPGPGALPAHLPGHTSGKAATIRKANGGQVPPASGRDLPPSREGLPPAHDPLRCLGARPCHPLLETCGADCPLFTSEKGGNFFKATA